MRSPALAPMKARPKKIWFVDTLVLFLRFLTTRFFGSAFYFQPNSDTM